MGERVKAGLEKVIAHAGNRARLAALLGVSRAAVCMWRHVPLHHLASVEKITGIPRRELRPDIYEE